jgi:hypothetical protein
MNINNSLNRSKIRIYMKLASPNTNDKFKNQFSLYAQTIRVLLWNLSNNSEPINYTFPESKLLQASNVRVLLYSIPYIGYLNKK